MLFLFVIMLLGVDRAEDLRVDPIPIQRPLAAIVGLGIVGLLIAAIVAGRDTGPLQPGSGLAVAADGDHDANIKALADNLFGAHVFAFEFTGVLLIVAVAGTALLTATDAAVAATARRATVGERRRGGRRSGADADLVHGARRRRVRHRRRRRARAAQPARAVHVHRTDAQRGQPHVRSPWRCGSATSTARPPCSSYSWWPPAVVVGLGIIVSILRRRPGETTDDLSELKG